MHYNENTEPRLLPKTGSRCRLFQMSFPAARPQVSEYRKNSLGWWDSGKSPTVPVCPLKPWSFPECSDSGGWLWSCPILHIYIWPLLRDPSICLSLSHSSQRLKKCVSPQQERIDSQQCVPGCWLALEFLLLTENNEKRLLHLAFQKVQTPLHLKKVHYN